MADIQSNMFSRLAVVLKDTMVNGDLCVREGIRLYGKVSGEVRSSGRVEIMAGAVVDGGVACEDLYVEGYIRGDVKTRVLEVGDGAVFAGKVETGRLCLSSDNYELKWLRLTKE